MATKFTEGPWFPFDAWGPLKSDGLMRALRIGPHGGGGLFVANRGDIIGTEEDLLLAAAAPDLYEALERLIEAVEDKDNYHDQGLSSNDPVVDAAKAALQKARGAKAEGR